MHRVDPVDQQPNPARALELTHRLVHRRQVVVRDRLDRHPVRLEQLGGGLHRGMGQGVDQDFVPGSHQYRQGGEMCQGRRRCQHHVGVEHGRQPLPQIPVERDRGVGDGRRVGSAVSVDGPAGAFLDPLVVSETEIGAEPEVGQTTPFEGDRVAGQGLVLDELPGDPQIARSRRVLMEQPHHAFAPRGAKGLLHVVSAG